MTPRTNLKRTTGEAVQEIGVSFAAATVTETAMLALAHKIPAVANNYSKYKLLGAGVLGSLILLFGKGSIARASGLAMIGLAGGSAGSMVAQRIMNGSPRNARLNGIQQKLEAKRAQLAAGQDRGGGNISQVRPVVKAPVRSMSRAADYSQVGFSDTIYLM